MPRSLGLYIHIPFCKRKCGYCDFYSLPRSEALFDKYKAALIAHLREAAPRLKDYRIDTIYFGGGTPSWFGAENIRDILDFIRRNMKVEKNAEITVEANPDSLNRQAVRQLMREGVNRISMGVQTADERLLRKIGRSHTYAQAITAVAAARDAGIENLSLDLIYGLPDQTLDSWKETLDKILALSPEHISCYGLELKEGTPLYAYRRDVPSRDDQADMYLYAAKLLRDSGFDHYEISNFALPGRYCRHNMKYWSAQEYLGFGPSAASDFDNCRFKNKSDLRAYMDGVLKNGEVIEENDFITISERAGEYIMLRLRTDSGICEQDYYEKFRRDFSRLEKYLVLLETAGYAMKIGTRWRLTDKGFLMSTPIIGELLEKLGGEGK